jgi:hypothetical protein
LHGNVAQYYPLNTVIGFFEIHKFLICRRFIVPFFLQYLMNAKKFIKRKIYWLSQIISPTYGVNLERILLVFHKILYDVDDNVA